MTHPRMNVVPCQSSTMTAVGVWESRGRDTGVIGDDRPRDFQRTGGARLADLQIQRDVDRASPVRALPQRPRGFGIRSRNSGSPREAEGEPCTCWPPFPPSVSSSTMHRYVTGLKPLQQSR